MSRLSPLFVLLLSGCWPMIPGKWADYDVPDETQIVGSFNYFQPLGGYWGDPTPNGAVAWGWLDTPQVGLQAVEPRVGCEVVDPADAGDPLDFVDIGATDARMRSSLGTIDLAFSADAKLFYNQDLTEDDAGAGVSWTLDNIDSDEGTFHVQTFVVMPPRLAFGGFSLEGDVPDSIARADYPVTWQAEPGADWVVLQLQLETSQSITETALCYAEVGDGAITVPQSIWSKMDTADGMYVYLGSSHETATKIEGVYGASRMASVWYQVGYVRFE